MREESLNFLEDLINSHSPSGYEGAAAKIWKERTAPFVDSIEADVHGNSISCINPEGDPRVMISGHIDEIGYMVKYIDPEGFLYFSTIGGIDPHLIPGQRVWVKGRKGDVRGVIGKKPIHLMKREEVGKVSKVEDLWIDIGAKNRKDAEKKVKVGDPAIADVGFGKLSGSKIFGRAYDDRAGAFVVSETMRLLSGKKLSAVVFGVATVQEEIGMRGARTSAYGVTPDIGLAVDLTFSADVPGIDKRTVGEVKLGGGPVIARGPNINPKIFNMLVESAEKEKIPYQVEGISRATGTDANPIQITKSGVAAGLISIPNRYMHTPVEVIDLNDLANAAKLLAAFIKKVNKKTELIPH